MERSKGYRDSRKYPRFLMDLPLEYRVRDVPKAYGGIAINGSETGLLMHSIKDLRVSMKLNVSVFLAKEFQLTHLEALAEIIWKDFFSKEDWEGYQYGLKIIQIEEEDLLTLRQLFERPLQTEEISNNLL